MDDRLGLIAKRDRCIQPVYEYILAVNVTMRSGLGMVCTVGTSWSQRKMVIPDGDVENMVQPRDNICEGRWHAF